MTEISKLILIPLAIAIGTLTLNAIISIKIKFASTAKEATRDIKSILFNIAFWSSQLYLLWPLYSFAVSSEPLTRMSVIQMLPCPFSLYNAYVFSMLNQINSKIKLHISLTSDTVDIIKSLPCQNSEKVESQKAIQ